MRFDLDDLDAEIRGHLAISVQQRIDDGEDPEAARLAALREFGNITRTRESIQAIWRPRWVEALGELAQDIRVALRHLRRAKGLTAAVAATLALGIGANSALFSVVRQVLFSPLVNRDADRLVYIRQSANGLGFENTTFSMPEIADLRSRATTIGAFGDFSTVDFTMVGVGEPRVVRAGVVSGSYFDVMGLRPILGRLLNAGDDGPTAESVAVLTHRFWTTSLDNDRSIVGRTLKLGSRTTTVVGVLEPSVPYPAQTEIIANVVTSPHHLGATMVSERTHRMTELFGRLAPGATLESARAELTSIHAAMLGRHPDVYASNADIQLRVTGLREQITSPARKVLLLLLAAAALVFAIACLNVVNLILARTVRRDSELAVRAALGASAGALRRTLLAESLVLCGAGAVLGVLLARPLVTLVGRYAARFSVRALDVTVDGSLLWTGAGLAMLAAVVLAYVPRLPSLQGPIGLGPATGSLRITPATNRRLRAFAVTQVALSFVLIAGAGVVVGALVALQTAQTGYNLRQVLAVDVPLPLELAGTRAVGFYQEALRRIGELPGVEQVAAGNAVPWRDAGSYGPGFSFAAEGYVPANGEERPHAQIRNVTPGFFATLGIPLLAGRDFTDEDRGGSEPVVIVSQSVARRLFANGNAVNRRLSWTDPYFGKPQPRRIVGVVADADDEHVVPGPALTIYHPFRQFPYVSRVFVQAAGDPYALVGPVTRTVRHLSKDQPVERAATLADVRTAALASDRLNAFVLSGFASVALLIAIVGVAGVLAFSVSARTREFAVRLAIGLTRRHLLVGVLSEGAVIAGIGIAAGAVAVGGYAIVGLAAGSFEMVRLPGVLAIPTAAVLLMIAAAIASLMPAARAARVDVVQALWPE